MMKRHSPMFPFVVHFVLIATVSVLESNAILQPETVYEWVKVEYDWSNDHEKGQYIQQGWFDPDGSVHLSGIDLYKQDIYVTALRFDVAVPSGLNKLVIKNGKPYLQPFPSLEMNRLGDCSHLIFPFTARIDPNTGLMYVIDVGRIGYGVDTSGSPCPAKIVVLDVINNGSVVRTHVLPENVAPRSSNGLNDLVLDYGSQGGTDLKFAYISDAARGELIVFDFFTNNSWSFKDPSMNTDEDIVVTMEGANYTFDFKIDGIALDAESEYVYYSAIGSRRLFQIPTSVLRDPQGDFASNVRFMGKKISNSDAIFFGHRSLYYGAQSLNAVYEWQVSTDIAAHCGHKDEITLETETEVCKDDVKFVFVDGLAIDEFGWLWFTSNRAHKWVTNSMDFSGASGANYRINRVFVGDDSYLVKDGNTVIG